jgi:hypothetical protein
LPRQVKESKASIAADIVPTPPQATATAESTLMSAVVGEAAKQAETKTTAIREEQSSTATTVPIGEAQVHPAAVGKQDADVDTETAQAQTTLASAAHDGDGDDDDNDDYNDAAIAADQDADAEPSSVATKTVAKPASGDGKQTLAYVLDRLANSNDFPALSQSVFEVNQLTSLQANATVSQIAEVILHDYALTNKLLTLANSAYYGVRVEVTRVTDAIRLLGFK